jgi:hypothetical protein
MSVQAITWAYSLEDVDDPIMRFVLVTLANYADDYGVCWPSSKTLVADLRCSERKLRDCTRALEAMGLIQRIERRRVNGSRRSNAFLLAGFEGRRQPTEVGDHPIIGPQDVGVKGTAKSINRHVVPGVTTGTTCRGARHAVPGDPAPRAPLEPSLEPSKEPYPLTPKRRRSKSEREAAKTQDDPPVPKSAPTELEALSGTAMKIKTGKPYFCQMISSHRARQCISAGLVTIEDCRKADISI